MSNLNQPKGKHGEIIAEKYLISKGFRIIKHNFRSKFGEIDLIATLKSYLVFVEVKTRFSDTFGFPYEAVTSSKIKSLLKTIDYYRELFPDKTRSPRLDVVSIILDNYNQVKNITHIENITS